MSIDPIKTDCGQFNVTATLHGAQPITSMEIVREGDDSGSFVALLGLNVRMSFTPVNKGGISTLPETLAFDHSFELESHPSNWASEAPENRLVGQVGGFVLTDTDGDNVVDTYLPGQSAFYPVGGARTGTAGAAQNEGCFPNEKGETCHESGTGGHCHCTMYPDNYPQEQEHEY